MTNELFSQISEEFQRPETKQKIQNTLFDPLLSYIHSKVVIYLQFLGLLMALMIILLVTILYIVARPKTS